MTRFDHEHLQPVGLRTRTDREALRPRSSFRGCVFFVDIAMRFALSLRRPQAAMPRILFGQTIIFFLRYCLQASLSVLGHGHSWFDEVPSPTPSASPRCASKEPFACTRMGWQLGAVLRSLFAWVICKGISLTLQYRHCVIMGATVPNRARDCECLHLAR